MSKTRAGRRREQIPGNRDQETKRLFKIEFENILFRSNRGAMMEYEVASKLDTEMLTYERWFYIVAGCGLVVAIISEVISKTWGGTDHRIFYFGMMAAIPTVMIEFFRCLNEILSKDTSTFVPFLRRRVAVHNNAAAKWQTLEREAQRYLIFLEQPGVTCDKLEEWHNKLLEERKEICMNVVVNSEDHALFNKEEKLLKNISSRNKVYDLYKRENFNLIDLLALSQSNDE